MAQVFISYSRRDLSFVERLAQDLKRAGHEVWYDLSGIEGGARWRAEIQNAIKNSEYVIVVLSPDSVESEWVEREFLFASNLKRKVIPLLYRPCEISLNYLNLNYIDVQGENYRRNFGELLQVLDANPTKRSLSSQIKPSKPPFTLKTEYMVAIIVASIGAAATLFAAVLPLLLKDTPITPAPVKTIDPPDVIFTSTMPTFQTETPSPTLTPTKTLTSTPVIVDFGGIWLTNIATLNLSQDGDKVTGSVEGYGGIWNNFINGVVRDNTLQLDKSSVFGEISFILSNDGNSFSSNDQGLSWCGVRTGSVPSGCGFSGKWYLSNNSNIIPSGSYAELIQSGPNVTGTVYSGDGSRIDSITGTVFWGKGYGLYGKGDRIISPFTWSVNYGGAVFVGSSDDNIDMRWCGWRDTSSMPDTCNF